VHYAVGRAHLPGQSQSYSSYDGAIQIGLATDYRGSGHTILLCYRQRLALPSHSGAHARSVQEIHTSFVHLVSCVVLLSRRSELVMRSQFGGYVVPRSSGAKVEGALLRRVISLVGGGAKGMTYFTFGPEYNFRELPVVQPARPVLRCCAARSYE
jgi:hypothetical protein